ncbi:MAG: hypothetical protein LBC53_01130 [Spirochaetaceae bacterium]|jgi:hypothetical protein|nr:hypothetical protein [Spirochaetaceae bacterium]
MKKRICYFGNVLTAVLALAFFTFGFASCDSGGEAPADDNKETGEEGSKTGEEGGSGDDTAMTFANLSYVSETAPDLENFSETSWTLTAGEYSDVYFAVNNPALSEITVGGADAGKVTQAAAGESVPAVAGGLTATAELAVFKVAANDLLFEGGARNFTLGDVAVTLNVTPKLTGAAVFKVEWPEGETYYDSAYDGGEYDTDGVFTGGVYNAAGAYSRQTLTRLDGVSGGPAAFNNFLQAIEYVDCNAEENTEYLIRVEQDELTLPRIFFIGNNQENVTVRVRGYGAPRALKCSANYGNNNDSYNKTVISAAPPFPGGSSNANMGFLNLGYCATNATIPFNKGIDFILDNNIIVKEAGNVKAPVYLDLIYIYYNATLVLRKGAVISDYYSDKTNTNINPIRMHTKTQYKGTPAAANDGKVRIEGGSIKDCTFGNIAYLIYSPYGEDQHYPGAFYMDVSTADNPITISGNTNNYVYFPYTKEGANTATPYNISNLLTSGTFSFLPVK